jgi:hypothetical protein
MLAVSALARSRLNAGCQRKTPRIDQPVTESPADALARLSALLEDRTPLVELGVDDRTVNALARWDVRTVADWSLLSESERAALPYVGASRRELVTTALEDCAMKPSPGTCAGRRTRSTSPTSCHWRRA